MPTITPSGGFLSGPYYIPPPDLDAEKKRIKGSAGIRFGIRPQVVG
jgi:hypothetical protein